MNSWGRPLIILGLILVMIGIVITLAPRIPWIGKLPGDIYLKRENFNIYFPLGTCILLSALLSLILWLFRR